MAVSVPINHHKDLEVGIVDHNHVDSEPLDQVDKLGELNDNRAAVLAEVREKAGGEWVVRNIMPQMQLIQIPYTSKVTRDSALFRSIAILYRKIFAERWGQIFEDIDASMNYFESHYEESPDGIKRFISVVIFNGIPVGAHVAMVGDCADLGQHAIDTIKGNYRFNDSMNGQFGEMNRNIKLTEIKAALDKKCAEGAKMGYQAELFTLDEETIMYFIDLARDEIMDYFTQLQRSSEPQDFDAAWLQRLMRSFIVYLKNRNIDVAELKKFDQDKLFDAIKRLISLVIAGSGLDYLQSEEVTYMIQWTADGFEPKKGKGRDGNAMASIFRSMMAKNKDATRRNLIRFISAFQDKKWLQYDKLKRLVALANEASILWEGDIVEPAFKDDMIEAPSSTRLMMVGLPGELAGIITNFILYKLAMTRDWHPRDLLELLKTDDGKSIFNTRVLLDLFI